MRRLVQTTLGPLKQLKEESRSPTRNGKGQFVKGQHYSPSTQFKKGQNWRPAKPYWNIDWLREEYEGKKKSAKQIAEKTGCTEANILHFLKKFNITRRDTHSIRKWKYWGLYGEKNGMFGKKDEKNPNWKGGITPERQSVYVSQDWKQVIPIVWGRANARCQRCGADRSAGKLMHLHHMKGFGNKETRTNPEFLVLLCKECHHWVHSRANIHRDFFKD